MAATGTPARHIPNALLIALIALLGFAAYANALSGQFVWDDKLLIDENAHIKGLAYLPAIFRSDLFHMSVSATGYFRPLQVMAYMADYAIWGKMPVGYHLSNLFLQIIAATLVFYLGILMTGDRAKSFFVAAAFCVHPAFVPVVGYISGRADLLGMLFGLAAVYAVIRCLRRPSGPAAAWTAVFFYALAILSKEYYLLMPLLIILHIVIFKDRYPPNKMVKAVLGSMCAVALTYLVLRATALNFHQRMGVIADQTFLTRLAIFPWITANYLGVLILPVNLSMEKVLSYTHLSEARFVMAYGAPVAVAAALWYFYRRRDRERLFWLGWWTLSTIPFLHLIMPLKAIWADHWAYLPSIGFFFFIATFFGAPARGPQAAAAFRKAGAAIGCLVLLFFMAITIRENMYWKDEETLFARILVKNPTSARTIYNTGKLYEEKGDLVKALEFYDKAIAGTAGRNAQYLNSRGMVYKNMGNKERARADFEAAVAVEPGAALYHNNLGCIYAELGMVDKARAEWDATVRLNPHDEFAKKNLRLIERR